MSAVRQMSRQRGRTKTAGRLAIRQMRRTAMYPMRRTVRQMRGDHSGRYGETIQADMGRPVIHTRTVRQINRTVRYFKTKHEISDLF